MIKILTIDDDLAIQYALKGLFKVQGWECVSAANMTQGLELFREHSPDIVLTDYHLPGLSGLEGVILIREMSPSVPIIVFTVDESQSVADRFLASGASDFAIKPIRAPDLISRVKLHIKLLENKVKNPWETRENLLPKGISAATLQFIETTMETLPGYMTADEISEASHLAYQTAYRYLQYMAEIGQVEVKMTYGKIGRPKQYYKLLD